jgi:hypothetical protein
MSDMAIFRQLSQNGRSSTLGVSRVNMYVQTLNGSSNLLGIRALWSTHRDITVVTRANTYNVTSADIFRGVVHCPAESQPISLVI